MLFREFNCYVNSAIDKVCQNMDIADLFPQRDGHSHGSGVLCQVRVLEKTVAGGLWDLELHGAVGGYLNGPLFAGFQVGEGDGLVWQELQLEVALRLLIVQLAKEEQVIAGTIRRISLKT